jgi:hypothetical protein
VTVKVDQDGLSERILALPLKPAGYDDLQVGATGQIFYRKEPGAQHGADTSLNRYDLDKRKEDTLAEAISGFQISADGKRVLVKVKDAWSICEVADKLDLAKEKLKLDTVQVRIDPVAECTQIFDEAWRINRDFFYDPGMQGPTEGDAGEVRRLPPRRDYAPGPHPGHAVAFQRAGRGPPPDERGRFTGRNRGHARWTPGRRLRNRDWALPLQEGLRRPQLDARPPLAAHRAGVDVQAGEYCFRDGGRQLHPSLSRFGAANRIVRSGRPNPDGKGHGR